jgi:hypothetical protein
MTLEKAFIKIVWLNGHTEYKVTLNFFESGTMPWVAQSGTTEIWSGGVNIS